MAVMNVPGTSVAGALDCVPFLGCLFVFLTSYLPLDQFRLRRRAR